MKTLILTLMKTNKIFTFFTIIAMSFAVTSCVQDDDYSVPDSLGEEENALLQALLGDPNFELKTIAEVKALYLIEDDPGDNSAVLIDTDHYVKGYVSSSDQTGNYFKEFYIQDSPTNPTASLKIIIDQVDTYNQFNIGREVYVNLKDLYVGEERIENGVITIGGDTETDDFGTTVERLNENQARAKVLRSTTTEEIIPLVVSQISDIHVGILVSIENVEFADNLAGLNYFDPIETFDTQRRLQKCAGASYSIFNLETSSFANFKNDRLPTLNGTITAVVSKTFDGSGLILALNTTDDVNFTEQRCELIDISDYVTVFEEDWSNGFADWFVINTEGSRTWEADTQASGDIASGSAFNGSGADVMVSWLISSPFDFDAQDDEQMVFEVADAFSDAGDEPLSAYYSNDYVIGDDPEDATWIEFGADQIAGLPINGGFFDNVCDATGLIDLSAVTGTAVFAFVYDSDNGSISSSRDICNVVILTP